MQTGLMLITLISLMIPAASSPQGSSSAYEVGEIIRILSGDSFECPLQCGSVSCAYSKYAQAAERKGIERAVSGIVRRC